MPAPHPMPHRALPFVLALACLAPLPARSAINPQDASRVFAEARAICERDGGALWGHSLCGPMLLVDPTDRAVVANQADAGGVLKPSGGVFVGSLPASALIANTRVGWSGTQWSEIMWPLPAETSRRHVMLAHEMFHRIQPALGMINHEGDNGHLDTLEGRYLLQLEWRALAQALRAPTTAARKAAIAEALAFRQERYRLFPQAAANERALESNEAIAEYTGVRLGLDTPQARRDYAVHDLAVFVDAPTFVRSFAYATGPAYGLLLDEADPAWRTRLGSDGRLDQLLASAWHLPDAAPGSIGAREKVYDDGSLRRHEVELDHKRRAQLAALKAKLVDGPVLILPLHHTGYQFNPQTLKPLGDLGTVFPTARVTDDWGSLTVEDDALLNQDAKRGTVSAKGLDLAHARGAGWQLELKPGWVIVPGIRKGDFVVQHQAAGKK